MRNRIKTALLLILIPLLHTGCEVKIEEMITGEGKIFYAETPSGNDTKTFVDGSLQVRWHEGDLISVFRSPVNERYRFAGNDGDVSSEVHKDDSSIPGAEYQRTYAIYPYNEEASCLGSGVVTTEFPATQNYVAGGFGKGANLMVAATMTNYDDVFYFKNAGSYLRLLLYGGDRIRQIKMYGNAGEKIAGLAAITVDPYAAPLVEMAPSSSTQVILYCGEGGVLLPEEKENAHSFWIVLPPVTFSEGFTIEITNTSGAQYIKSTSKPLSFVQNKIKTMSAIKLDTQNVKDILSFSLSDGVNNYPAFNIGEDNIDVHVPNGTDMSALTASFTYNGAGVTVDDMAQTSGESVQDFSDFVNPVTYVVHSVSGGRRSYTVRMFDLPVVFVDTPSPITSKDNWTAGCSISILEDNGTLTDYGNAVEVRGRGNSTWGRPKKPYTFKLSSKASVLGLPADKRWNLLANFYDRTLIRNAVSLEVAHRTEGMPWASHGVFVELVLNGVYLGNYYLCEHNKIAVNRVNITEIGKNDVSGDAITGGYLLEYDMWNDDDPHFISEVCNFRVKFKSPDDPGFEVQQAWIEQYINEMEHLLDNEESLAARTYLDYMDIDSFIDWWFTYEISGNGPEPNVPHSSFMYKDRGGKLCAGPVWDFDQYTYKKNLKGFQLKNAIYYKYLFKDSYYVARVKEKWPRLVARLEGMSDYIDDQINTIANSAARNATMWQSTGDNGDNSLSVPEASARLKTVFLNRITELTGLINNLTVDYDNKDGGNEDFGDQTGDGGGWTAQ